MDKEVPNEIKYRLKIMERTARILRFIHASLGIAATVCSLLVAAKINSFDRTLIEWLSFLAAVSIGLLSAFDVGNKANRFRRAWRKLNGAVLRFQGNTNFSKEDLIKAYEEAEEIVGDVKEEPK